MPNLDISQINKGANNQKAGEPESAERSVIQHSDVKLNIIKDDAEDVNDLSYVQNIQPLPSSGPFDYQDLNLKAQNLRQSIKKIQKVSKPNRDYSMERRAEVFE